MKARNGALAEGGSSIKRNYFNNGIKNNKFE